MKLVGIWWLAVGVLALGFGGWGSYTAAGRRAFDERAGILPQLSLGLGGVLLGSGILVWWLRLRIGSLRLSSVVNSVGLPF